MLNPAKSIELPQDLQAFAEESVRAGEYASLAEVTADAFRLLKQRGECRKKVRDELGEISCEMEAGNYVEPTDDEFARAVHERALKHIA